jgi:hypothetical protein
MNIEDNLTQRIAEIACRCEAARSAPWVAYIEDRDFSCGSSFIAIGEGDDRDEDLYLTGDDRAVPVADLDFIAHARQDIPFLLAEVKRLQQIVANLKLTQT